MAPFGDATEDDFIVSVIYGSILQPKEGAALTEAAFAKNIT